MPSVSGAAMFERFRNVTQQMDLLFSAARVVGGVSSDGRTLEKEYIYCRHICQRFPNPNQAEGVKPWAQPAH